MLSFIADRHHQKSVSTNLRQWGLKPLSVCENNPSPKKAAYAEKIGLKWMTVKTSVMHSPKEEDIRKFLTIVNNPANHPVYVCCVGGRDRSVFYVTAYKIAIEGADPDKAVEDMDGSAWHKFWPGISLLRRYSQGRC